MREQGFPRACLAEKDDRHLRFRSQRSQLQTTCHGLIACGQVLDSQSGERLLHRDPEDLLPHAFAKLANWFERIFDQCPSADDDVRVSLHPDAQRQTLSWPWRDHIAIKRT